MARQVLEAKDYQEAQALRHSNPGATIQWVMSGRLFVWVPGYNPIPGPLPSQVIHNG